MSEIKPCPDFSPEAIEAASIEADRLCRELDITNADHIALWLESWLENDCSVAFLACRIIEAHEAVVADVTASRDRASDACATVQKERDEALAAIRKIVAVNIRTEQTKIAADFLLRYEAAK